MADPLSAFSLACNVLQMVEMGAKILAKTAEYRKASGGALEEQDRLANTLRSLKEMSTELEHSTVSSGKVKVPPQQERLVAANNECLRISNDIVDLLEKLKVKTKYSMIESISKSIKSMWLQARLDSMKVALAEAQNHLSIAFLAYLQHMSATQHRELLKRGDEVERQVAETIKAGLQSTNVELKTLSKAMERTLLASMEDGLEEISDAVRMGFTQQNELIKRELLPRLSVNTESTEQLVLDSLRFPDMHTRKLTIERAFDHTFEWMFQSNSHQQAKWDDLVSWLGSNEQDQRMYWIAGKPGSGKSTLSRFLFERINADEHMLPWASSQTVVKASFFFWSPGTELQRSRDGMLRSLLAQMLEQVPALIPKCVPPELQNDISLSWDTGRKPWSWGEYHLRRTINDLISASNTHFFLLIDGIDELKGLDGNKPEDSGLLNFLSDVASYGNVKLCVSSRPYNAFQRYFEKRPQLRLEFLTRGDIKRYVDENFQRYYELQPQTKTLVDRIVERASGVFLWVKLVVGELLQALSDGDSARQLLKTLEEIPDSLHKYFERLIKCIPLDHRKEASIYLQIVLHDEPRFGLPVHLPDILLAGQGKEKESFVLDPEYGFQDFDLTDPTKRKSEIDSGKRRVNKCLGLLECHYLRVSRDIEPSEYYVPRSDSSEVMEAFSWKVNFLHRSFRDYLLDDNVKGEIYKYSEGIFDARLFLCNARLAQVLEVDKLAALYGTRVSGRWHRIVRRQYGLILTLANQIYCTCSLPELRSTQYSVRLVTRLEEVLAPRLECYLHESWWRSLDWEEPDHLTRNSISTYTEEQSSLLTIAIDFNLEAYIRTYLTSDVIRNKGGRPILDYITTCRPDLDVIRPGDRPNINTLELALSCGADPNEHYSPYPMIRGEKGKTVWSRFLEALYMENITSTAKRRLWVRSPGGAKIPPDDITAYQKSRLAAVKLLLQKGASPLILRDKLPHEVLEPVIRALELATSIRRDETGDELVPVAWYLAGLGNDKYYRREDMEPLIALAYEKLAIAQAAETAEGSAVSST